MSPQQGPSPIGPAGSVSKEAPVTVQESVAAVHHRRIDVDGTGVFFREAGPEGAPAILLLHGFPTSSFQFRHLIPALADSYHVLAPDYPGFGFTDITGGAGGKPATFDAIATTIGRLIDILGLRRYAMYLFDYGAPVGFRLAERWPERVSALLIQNGNAYEEGLGVAWAPVRAYWANPSTPKRDALRALFTEEGLRGQYLTGEPDPSLIAPECWLLDQTMMERTGVADLQLDLLFDYRNNIARYPQWQAYLRTHQPPALITWGRNDLFFPAAGAEAYRKDLRDVELHFLEAGHFALESNGEHIASLIHDFLDRKVDILH